MLNRIQIIRWILILFTAGVTSAAYLDAEPGSSGNTALASDLSPDNWWINATADDNIWGYRAFGYDQNGVLGGATKDIYEASGTGSGAEDCPVIVTTISGLTPGRLYRVEVVYWSSTAQNWNVRAGFEANNMILFDYNGSLGVAGTATGDTDGDRVSLTGTVGTATADTLGQIKVFIDDLPGSGYADRTWYEGLKYEDVGTGCTELLYDFTGPEGEPDCIIDLYDLAEIAAHWLECTLVPESACEE